MSDESGIPVEVMEITHDFVAKLAKGECPICNGELLEKGPHMFECPACKCEDGSRGKHFIAHPMVGLEIARLRIRKKLMESVVEDVTNITKLLDLSQEQTVALLRYFEDSNEALFGRSLLP